MTRRGPKRVRKDNLPRGIANEQLPDGVHWNKSGKGHWYRSFTDAAGIRRTKKIAGPNVTLADLHALMEQENGVRKNTFRYISELFQESPKWKTLAESTKADYRRNHRVVSTFQTKLGTELGDASLKQWNTPMVQRLIDKLTESRGPTAAAHALRYARRVFSWAVRRGYALTNPCSGVEAPEEKGKKSIASDEAYAAVLKFAVEQGSPYIWFIMELAYLCRLRGVEVLDFTDAHASEKGVMAARRKGSRNNIVRWNNRLKKAWQAAEEYRNKILEKHPHLPRPQEPEERFLILAKHGRAPLKKSTLDTAWQRMITAALEQGVIKKQERFSLHAMKRKGITDTEGSAAEKREASGHVTESKYRKYDMSVPVVDAAADE